MSKKLTIVFVALATLIAIPALATQTQYLEGVVEASGANGSHYTSTVNFYNPGSSANAIEVRYITNFRTVLGPYRFTLGPNETLHKQRFATVFQEGNVYGTLVITSDQPVIVSGQTLNDADPSRTYGLGLIPQQESSLLVPPQVGHTSWTTNTPAYRTNVQITFVEAGEVHISVIRNDGKPMKFQRVSSDRAFCWQVSLASLLEQTTYPGDSGLPLEDARIEYRVVSGRALALAVVNDNVTSDGVIDHAQLVRGESLPRKYVVGGISEAAGMNGTFWRTKARFSCPTLVCDLQITPVLNELLVRDGEPMPWAGVQYRMYPGQQISTDDLLAYLIKDFAPGTIEYAGRAGMMVVESRNAVVAFATANVDPAGVRPGSFAADTQPVPYEQAFLRKLGGKGVFIGVDQTLNTPGYRSNISFMATRQCSIPVHFLVRNQAGAVVGEKDVLLDTRDSTIDPRDCADSRGWVQKNVADWLSGINLPEAATIEVTNLDEKAEVTAVISRIDNATGDPAIYNIVVLP